MRNPVSVSHGEPRQPQERGQLGKTELGRHEKPQRTNERRFEYFAPISSVFMHTKTHRGRHASLGWARPLPAPSWSGAWRR